VFSDIGKRISGVTAVVCVLMFLTPAALAAGPDGNSPASAMAPSGQWVSLNVGDEDWYLFRTPGTASDKSQVTIEVQAAPVNGVTFTVWDAEGLNKKANAGAAERVEPLGAGSAEPLDALGFVQKLLWSGAMATKGPFYVSVKQVGEKAGGYAIKTSGDKLSFPAMPDVAAKAVEAPKAAAQAVTAAAGTTQKDGSGPDNAFTPAGEWKTLGAKEGHWYVINVPGADADGYMPQVTVELKAIPPGSANFCIWTPEGLRIWKTGAQDETTLPVGRSSALALSAQEVAQKSLWSGKFNIGGSYYICARQTGPNPSTYKLDVTVK
jgi:hypothetical protein